MDNMFENEEILIKRTVNRTLVRILVICSLTPFITAIILSRFNEALYGLVESSFVILIIGLVLVALVEQISITVTNRRVYGKSYFGKRVDLPLDSISAVAMSDFLGTLTVATSSGRISFMAIVDRELVYSKINQLIINRQSEKKKVTISQPTEQSSADELKKFKELLDSGVITQEEFDAKKKQLLGL